MAIEGAPSNTAMSPEDLETKAVVTETTLSEYFVPEYGITIRAASLDEAIEKAKAAQPNTDNV